MSEKEPPVNWKKNLLFIWLSQFLAMAGYSSALPFIPIYMRDTWGIHSESELGAWVATFNFFGLLSFCVFTPIWGALSDCFGRKLMLLRACYVDALLFPCMLLAPSPFWLVVVRFIVSIFTGTVAAAQTLIVTNTPEEHHGFALGTLASAFWSGNLAGFSIGGFVVHYCGFTTAFLGCGSLYLLGGLMTHLFVHENFQRPAASKKVGFFKSVQGLSIVIWLLLFLIVFTAIARRFDDPYVALMIERIHGPADTAFHTGWINALVSLGGVLSGILFGKLVDLFSPRSVAVPATLLAGVTMLMQGWAMTLTGYVTWRFANYLVAGGLETVFLAMMSKASPTERRGTVLGISSSLRTAGLLIGAPASGVVVYYMGVREVYLVSGILLFLAVPILLLTLHYLKHHQVEEPHEISGAG